MTKTKLGLDSFINCVLRGWHLHFSIFLNYMKIISLHIWLQLHSILRERMLPAAGDILWKEQYLELKKFPVSTRLNERQINS